MDTKRWSRLVIALAVFCLAAGNKGYAGQSDETRDDQNQTPVAISEPSQQEKEYLQTGIQYFFKGEYEEALDELTKARNQKPNSSEAAYYLGLTYKKMEDYSKAGRNLKDAVTMQPPVKSAFIELADVYYLQGKNEEAIQTLDLSDRDGIEPGQAQFLRGLVLVKKKKYKDAVNSFEKSRNMDPALLASADFQIATIYGIEGKNAEALSLYQSISDREPNSDIGDMARQQMESLRKQQQGRRPFHASADIQYQHDSNVILQPDSGPTITASQQSDSATVVSARFDYSPTLRAPFGLKFDYSFYLDKYMKLTTFDMQSHTLGATPSYRIGGNRLDLPVYWNTTTVNSQKYLDYFSLSPQYTFATGEDRYALAWITYQKKNYQSNPVLPDENRSGNNVAAGIGWTRLIAEQKGFINAKYELNKENTTGVNWSYLGNRISANILYPAARRLNILGTVDIFLQNFSNTNTSFSTNRNDKTYTGNVQAFYSLTSFLDLHLQYTYNKNDSTIPVYGYSKSVVGGGLYAKF